MFSAFGLELTVRSLIELLKCVKGLTGAHV